VPQANTHETHSLQYGALGDDDDESMDQMEGSA
jgi:hypothetical protein